MSDTTMDVDLVALRTGLGVFILRLKFAMAAYSSYWASGNALGTFSM